jgi:hypothetical protein
MPCPSASHAHPNQSPVPPTRCPTPPPPPRPAERAAILSWMSKSDTSPLTNQPLVRGALMPNKLVRAIVDEMALLNL